MKKKLTALFVALALAGASRAQEYPYQNPSLSPHENAYSITKQSTMTKAKASLSKRIFT